jgi:hypothetical protein
MARPLRRAAAIIAAAGVLLCLAGSGIAAVGLLRPDLISSQIPPGFIDTPAVGGATFALGVALLLLGLAHVGAALALRAQMKSAATVSVVLSANMGVLAFLFAVAALVSAASGSATPVLMLPAAGVLLIGAAAYAAAARWALTADRPSN